MHCTPTRDKSHGMFPCLFLSFSDGHWDFQLDIGIKGIKYLDFHLDIGIKGIKPDFQLDTGIKGIKPPNFQLDVGVKGIFG